MTEMAPTGLCSGGKIAGERTFCETMAEMRSVDTEICCVGSLSETKTPGRAVMNALVFRV